MLTVTWDHGWVAEVADRTPKMHAAEKWELSRDP